MDGGLYWGSLQYEVVVIQANEFSGGQTPFALVDYLARTIGDCYANLIVVFGAYHFDTPVISNRPVFDDVVVNIVVDATDQTFITPEISIDGNISFDIVECVAAEWTVVGVHWESRVAL